MTIFNIRNVLWTLFALVKLVIVAASASAEEVEAPAHMLASVRIVNGAWGGSGTIIGPGREKWAPGLSCGHVFVGKINGEFTVNYPDGTSSKAVLRRHDPRRDLSLFFVPTKSVLEFASVPRTMPPVAKYHVCGYPKMEGPKFYAIRPSANPVVIFNNGMSRWQFDTKDGSVLWGGEKLLDQHNAQIIGGNSGCGVFANGQVCGVLSHNGAVLPGQPSPTLFSCPHSEIVAFLNECRDEKQYCGEWFAEPAMPQAAPAPPPEIDESSPPPAWKPKPNIPITPKVEAESEGGNEYGITPGKDSEGYTGKGKPPKDLNHNKRHAVEIDELRGRVHRLEELAASGKLKGEPGQDGQDGKDFTPPVVEKHPAKHDFTPLIIACVVAVGLGKFIGYKLGF